MFNRRKICKQFCYFVVPTVIVLGLIHIYSREWWIEQTRRSDGHNLMRANGAAATNNYGRLKHTTRYNCDDCGSAINRNYHDTNFSSARNQSDYYPNSLGKVNSTDDPQQATDRGVPPDLYRLAPKVFDTFPTDFLPDIRSPCWQDSSSQQLQCLPSFFVTGFPRCGTRDIHIKLTQHPGIVQSIKEPDWWTRRLFEGSSVLDYSNVFKTLAKGVSESVNASKTLIAGDYSVTTAWKYGIWQKIYTEASEPPYVTADLIRQVLPKSKIIFLLRDPVTRVYSDYLYTKFLYQRDRRWEEPRASATLFHRDVLVTMKTINACLEEGKSMRVCSYNYAETTPVRLAIGHYIVYLRDWFRAFPRDQILVLRLEDWTDNCEKWLPIVFNFLDQAKLSNQTISKICVKKVKTSPRLGLQLEAKLGGALPNGTMALLDEWYAPLNRELAEFLGDGRFLWTAESRRWGTTRQNPTRDIRPDPIRHRTRPKKRGTRPLNKSIAARPRKKKLTPVRLASSHLSNNTRNLVLRKIGDI